LQIADFISRTPRNIMMRKSSLAGPRTPGQILSLTTHLSFANSSAKSSSTNPDWTTDSLASVRYFKFHSLSDQSMALRFYRFNDFIVYFSTMSDGNITHHHSPSRKNTSLGASPEKQRTRTTSSSSASSYSPIKLPKRPLISTSSEEEEENIENRHRATSVTAEFASLGFKKSHSRLPLISKRPRLSLEKSDEEGDDVKDHDNSTPLSALPKSSRKRNVR